MAIMVLGALFEDAAKKNPAACHARGREFESLRPQDNHFDLNEHPYLSFVSPDT